MRSGSPNTRYEKSPVLVKASCGAKEEDSEPVELQARVGVIRKRQSSGSRPPPIVESTGNLRVIMTHEEEAPTPAGDGGTRERDLPTYKRPGTPRQVEDRSTVAGQRRNVRVEGDDERLR